MTLLEDSASLLNENLTSEVEQYTQMSEVIVQFRHRQEQE